MGYEGGGRPILVEAVDFASQLDHALFFHDGVLGILEEMVPLAVLLRVESVEVRSTIRQAVLELLDLLQRRRRSDHLASIDRPPDLEPKANR
eukprot:3597229-Pyramimonas_sp.AAC.1